eukprot:12470185-Ditylum_brightwellii.AAC.1
MTMFGMKVTLVRFQDHYYNYKELVDARSKKGNKDDNNLAIGVFKVTFCADASTTFVYEMCKDIILKLSYVGTYQDDGLTVFERRRMPSQTIKWLHNFQHRGGKVVGGPFFQFTAKLWQPLEANPTKVFKAISEGVFMWLGQLTSLTADNITKQISKLYLAHTAALEKVKKLPRKTPMIGEIHIKEHEHQERQNQVQEEKEKNKDGRRIFFVLGHA